MFTRDKYEARPGDVLVNIDVADLEQASTFYMSALGLRLGRRLGPTIIELLGANTALYLIEKASDTTPFVGATSTRTYTRHWTPVHLDFVVSDLGSALQRAIAAGAKIEAAPTSSEWGKLAVFSDPWGNGFCLLEFTPAGYDAIAD